eukprot:4948254-Prymnesium_polylepis.1
MSAGPVAAAMRAVATETEAEEWGPLVAARKVAARAAVAAPAAVLGAGRAQTAHVETAAARCSSGHRDQERGCRTFGRGCATAA